MCVCVAIIHLALLILFGNCFTRHNNDIIMNTQYLLVTYSLPAAHCCLVEQAVPTAVTALSYHGIRPDTISPALSPLLSSPLHSLPSAPQVTLPKSPPARALLLTPMNHQIQVNKNHDCCPILDSSLTSLVCTSYISLVTSISFTNSHHYLTACRNSVVCCVVVQYIVIYL